MNKWARRATVAATLITLLAGAGFAIYRYHYPYGWTHCCDSQLGRALNQYAVLHGGWFPRGEVTPEASLSLIYRMDPASWYLLGGKTVPESVVKSQLESGQLLTPETCSWLYVEGLRSDDDPRLALFWDKIGLGHNGERRPDGGHMMVNIQGIHQNIPGAEWAAFLSQQEELRSALKRPPSIPDKP